MSITINELITKLTFQQDKAGATRYEKMLSGIGITASKMVDKMDKDFTRLEKNNHRRFYSMSRWMTNLMDSSFDRMLRSGQRAFYGLERRFAGLQRKIGQGFSATVKLHGLEKESARISAMHGKFLNVKNALIGSALTTGAVKAGSAVYGSGKQYESQMSMLGTVFGETKANSLYDQAVKFAGVTPTNTKDILDFMMTFKPMGINVADNSGNLNTKMLESFGNLAATSPRIRKFERLQETLLSILMGRGDMVDNFAGLLGKSSGGILTITNTEDGKKTDFDMEDDPKARQKIFQYLMKRGFEPGRAGAMMKMGETLEGKQAQLEDSWDRMLVNIYLPLQRIVHKVMGKAADLLEKMEKSAGGLGRSLAVFINLDLPRYLDKIEEILPFVGVGLGVMYGHMVGITTLKFAMWLLEAEAALRAMGLAGAFANGALFGLPLLIGGVVLAIGALGADFVYWFNTGDSKILEFTERWPKLKEKIESAYESWKIFYYALEIGFENIGEDSKNAWAWLNDLPGSFAVIKFEWKIVSTLFKTSLEIIKGLWKAIWDGIAGSMKSLENMHAWLKKTFPFLEKVSNFISGIKGYQGDGGGGSEDSHDGHNHGGPASKTEADLMRFVYPSMLRMGRGGLGKRGANAHGYEARDVAVAMNQPVLAAENGRVANIFNDPKGYGKTVLIDHGNGYQTLYAHNSSIQAKIGQMVYRGQQLALSGSSGSSSGPHGHFEIRKDNKKVNISQHLGPLQNSAEKVKMPSATSKQPMLTSDASIVIQQNFNGPANPQQTRNAAQMGVQMAVHRANLSVPRPAMG